MIALALSLDESVKLAPKMLAKVHRFIATVMLSAIG